MMSMEHVTDNISPILVCPRCDGIGYVETADDGVRCFVCDGDGRVEMTGWRLCDPDHRIVPASALPTPEVLAALRVRLRQPTTNPTRETEAADAVVRAWLDGTEGETR